MENNDLLIGKIVAEKYQIIELIGSGGQGSVYKARHLRLNKIVALKILRSDYMDDPKIASRFHHEAQIASQLEHPNIVRAIDHGKCEETNVVWIEMDYVDGAPLKDLLKPPKESPNSIPRLEVERSINIVIQLCDGIYYAHKRKGVLHRDIKPSNILLTDKDDKPDIVKITDFGIAKILIESEELKRLTKTETGNLEGTCLYMAPEQFKEGYKPDFPLDVYSIGCLLFELLTGSPPFKGDSDLATINMHITAKIPNLVLDSVEPAIRSRLANIVFKALAKEPSMRYQSVDDLRNDLELAKLRLEQIKLGKSNVFILALEKLWLFLSQFIRNIQDRFFSIMGTSIETVLLLSFIIIVIIAVVGSIFLFNPFADTSIESRELPLKPIVDPSIKVPDQNSCEALWRKLQASSTHNPDPDILERSLEAFIAWGNSNKAAGNYSIANSLYSKAEQITAWLKLNHSIVSADINNSIAESCLLANTQMTFLNQIQKEQISPYIIRYGKFVDPETLRRGGLVFAANAAQARDSSLVVLRVMKDLGRKEDTPQELLALGFLAKSFEELKDTSEAQGNYDKFDNAMILNSNLSSEILSSRVAFIVTSAGRFYLRQKQIAKAQALLTRSIGALPESNIMARYNLAVMYNDLGLTKEMAKENKEAERFFQQSYCFLIASDSDRTIYRAQVLSNLAIAAFKAGDYKSAIRSKLAGLFGIQI